MNVACIAWGLFWGGSRSTCVFPRKVAAAGDERYLMRAAVAAALVSSSNRFLLCSATSGCSCVRNYIATAACVILVKRIGMAASTLQ